MQRFLDFDFRKENKLWPLFLNESFRSVATSLLALFSSIYIFKTLLALTHQEKTALLGVFIFFFSLYGFKLVSNLLAEEWSLKLGLKKQIYLGLFFLIISLIILIFSLKNPLALFGAAPFWGVSVGFYWFGRHGLMVKKGRKKDFGKELGIVALISKVLLIGVPFLGGLLINYGGYSPLFGAAFFFVLLAGLSLKPLREEKTRHNTSIAEVFRLFKTHKRAMFAYAGDSAGLTIYVVAIPLYLYFILGKELFLGEFFTLSMILVALINLLIGRWVDLKGKRKMIAFGAVASSLVWLGRFYAQAIGVLFVLDILDQITVGMTGIPLNVWTYQKALDGHSAGRAILFREAAVILGHLLACGCLIFLVLLGISLEYSFLAAAFFSLWPGLIVKKRKQ